MQSKQALFWNTLGTEIRCTLCPHYCEIDEGGYGKCKVRQNRNGFLFAQSYGLISALGIDPVEKKPLFHFHPGSKTLSFGSFGCNLSCSFCQNFQISQNKPEKTTFFKPDDALYFALEKNIKLISYTYNEPVVNYEWVLETAELARKKGMENILISNGYINEKPLNDLSEFIDAANIDLKSFDNNFYKGFCKATLKPVLKTIEFLHSNKIHIEITNLLIENKNTDIAVFDNLIDFLADLSNEIPLHLLRYFPAYKVSSKATDEKILTDFYNKAKKKIKHVYLGNVGYKEFENTYCKKCGFTLIERDGYNISLNCKNPRICCNCGVKNNIIL